MSMLLGYYTRFLDAWTYSKFTINANELDLIELECTIGRDKSSNKNSFQWGVVGSNSSKTFLSSKIIYPTSVREFYKTTVDLSNITGNVYIAMNLKCPRGDTNEIYVDPNKLVRIKVR